MRPIVRPTGFLLSAWLRARKLFARRSVLRSAVCSTVGFLLALMLLVGGGWILEILAQAR